PRPGLPGRLVRGLHPSGADGRVDGGAGGGGPDAERGGIRVVGGSYPARIWSAYMTAALGSLPVVDFPAPDPGLIPRGHYLRVRGDRTRTTTTFRHHRRRTPTTSGSSTGSPTGPSTPPASTPSGSTTGPAPTPGPTRKHP